jgi:hypothetical protein
VIFARYATTLLIALTLAAPAHANGAVSTVSDWIDQARTVYWLPDGRPWCYEIYLHMQERWLSICDTRFYGQPTPNQSVLFLNYTSANGLEYHQIFIGEAVYGDQA